MPLSGNLISCPRLCHSLGASAQASVPLLVLAQSALGATAIKVKSSESGSLFMNVFMTFAVSAKSVS